MKTILCYGDSNTYGLKSDLVSRYPRNVRWTGILQEKLGSEYYVIEEGLGGRTTVWDDPVEDYKNGKKYLLPCLDSHKPLDLVIIMLGTNDLKSRFSVTPFDIGASMENLSLIHIYTPKSPYDAVNSKIVLVPENRRLEGLITNQTVNFNTNIPTLSVLRVIKNLPFISPRKSKAVTCLLYTSRCV